MVSDVEIGLGRLLGSDVSNQTYSTVDVGRGDFVETRLLQTLVGETWTPLRLALVRIIEKEGLGNLVPCVEMKGPLSKYGFNCTRQSLTDPLESLCEKKLVKKDTIYQGAHGRPPNGYTLGVMSDTYLNFVKGLDQEQRLDYLRLEQNILFTLNRHGISPLDLAVLRVIKSSDSLTVDHVLDGLQDKYKRRFSGSYTNTLLNKQKDCGLLIKKRLVRDGVQRGRDKFGYRMASRGIDVLDSFDQIYQS